MRRILEINSTILIIENDDNRKVFQWDKLEKVAIRKISNSKYGNSAAISNHLFFENNDHFLRMRDYLFDYLGIQNVFLKVDFDINDEFLLYEK